MFSFGHLRREGSPARIGSSLSGLAITRLDECMGNIVRMVRRYGTNTDLLFVDVPLGEVSLDCSKGHEVSYNSHGGNDTSGWL